MNQDVMNCPSCDRKTPAGRAICLYCGAPLPVTRIDTAPQQRAIDSAEQAFNTVLQPSQTPLGERGEAALASALNIEIEEARIFAAAAKPVPLSRSLTRHEAELVAALVRTCGFGSIVVPDADLRLEMDLVRARRIVISGGNLLVNHSGRTLTVPSASIKLMVVGLLRNSRTDYTEGIAGMRGQAGSVLDSFEYRSEEMLLDVYAGNLETSFRIHSDAFDYSGLVNPLSFRAELNFKSAISKIKAAAPTVVVDEDFSRLRRLLGRAWPERSRTESRGVKRAGIAYRLIAKSSVISDNRDQFERYSRLMFALS